jgi:hypothetical protein
MNDRVYRLARPVPARRYHKILKQKKEAFRLLFHFTKAGLNAEAGFCLSDKLRKGDFVKYCDIRQHLAINLY